MKTKDPNHLTPRSDGRFAKKFRGVQWVSRSRDPDEAMQEWLDAKAQIIEGIANQPKVGAITVKDVINEFLNERQDRMEAGTMKGRTTAGYFKAAKSFGEIVGMDVLVKRLTPEDFNKARATWSAKLGPWKLSERVTAVRTMFRWAKDVPRLIDFDPWYGDQFKIASASEKRRVAREKARDAELIFTGEEIKRLLSGAGVPLRAMILLGLNGGMYAKDCASLRRHEIRQQDGDWVVDTERGKNGVPWKFALWPETKAALEEVAITRPKPKKSTHADLVFVTVWGNPFYQDVVKFDDADILKTASEWSAISQEFDRLCERVGVKRDGMGFGRLRHTYISAVDDIADRNASRRSRGHLVPGIEAHYRKITVMHLRDVAKHARRRLLCEPGIY